MKQDTFSSYHPMLNLCYFTFVLGVTMFLAHPVFLLITLTGGAVYSARLRGVLVEMKSFFCFSLPVILIVALMNPLFNHYGVTVLGYLPNGNPITLESLVYGLVMALMLCGVMTVFRCLNEVMTSDKYTYLFGTILPAISLILSMVMRFVPEFRHRAGIIRNGQKGIGRDMKDGSVLQKIRYGMKILSILITWSLEDAINTADSMKARGYGLPGRTAFSIYRFDSRDAKLLLVFLGLGLSFLLCCCNGLVYADYNPRILISGWPAKPLEAAMYLNYALFCFMPVILDLLEQLKWKRLQNSVERQTSDETQSKTNWRVFDLGE